MFHMLCLNCILCKHYRDKETFVLFVSQNVLMELLVLGVLDSVPARTMEPVMWLMAPVIAQRGIMVSTVNNVSSLDAHVALLMMTLAKYFAIKLPLQHK